MRVKIEHRSEMQKQVNNIFLTFIKMYGFKTLTDFCNKNNIDYAKIRYQLRGRHYIQIDFINDSIQTVNSNFELKILNNGKTITIGSK
jgi:hypothetical protein